MGHEMQNAQNQLVPMFEEQLLNLYAVNYMMFRITNHAALQQKPGSA